MVGDEHDFQLKTTWGWPAKTLHWVGAVIILLLLGHGWWMTHMTPRPDRLANYAGHSALGYDLLALIVLRLLWRWLNPVPELPADLKPWERLRLLGTPCSTSYVGGIADGLDGRHDVPRPHDQGCVRDRRAAARDRGGSLGAPVDRGVDKVLAYVLAAVVLIHVIGALRHHILKRNDVLRRMTWGMRA